MKTRVVVTGMGAITPIGNDVESFWQGLKDKTVGIGPITYFDTTDHLKIPSCIPPQTRPSVILCAQSINIIN